MTIAEGCLWGDEGRTEGLLICSIILDFHSVGNRALQKLTKQ